MRSKLRSQSKKKLKEDVITKDTVKKEENKKRSYKKSSNKINDDQNTKTIPNAFSIKKQLTQKKQQLKQKSLTKQQRKSYQKNKQQSRSISHKRKNLPQLSQSKLNKKPSHSKKRQLHQDKSEGSREDENLMVDIEDIIEKQLEMQNKQQKRVKNLHFRKKSQQSFLSNPSNQEIVKTIFFPKKHKNIEGKSTHQKLIIQGIMRVDKDLKKRKQKNKNNNMKKLTRKVNMKVERLKNEVDKEIMNGEIMPWLLPEWGLGKLQNNKSKDIREWMREGFGFDCIQENSENEERRQQSAYIQQYKNPQLQPNHPNHRFQDNPHSTTKLSNSQQQNIYYERAIINQNFEQHYNTGMKFLYEHLPKRQITLQEFQSYEDFVKSNFIIVYYLSRFYYKNFDKTKRYFTDSAQFDKYYTQDLMDCFQYIFPQVKEIVENQWKQKFQQGWDEYDENVGVRAYEQRRQEKMRKDGSRIKQNNIDEEQQMEEQQEEDMIGYKDWLQIFKKAFKPTDKQQVNKSTSDNQNHKQSNQQKQQHLISPPLRSEQKLQVVEQWHQIQMVESNNFVTRSINEESYHFESPMSKGIQRMKFMQVQQEQQKLLQERGQMDLDEYYHQISTIIKSKRKEDYNSSNNNTSSVQRSQSSTNQFDRWYQQQQSITKQQSIKQNEPQKILIKTKKHKHKKTNKRLSKSMIELRKKVNIDSSDSGTEEHIQGIDEAFHLEDEQDN